MESMRAAELTASWPFAASLKSHCGQAAHLEAEAHVQGIHQSIGKPLNQRSQTQSILLRPGQSWIRTGARVPLRHYPSRREQFVVRAKEEPSGRKGISFGDQLLDYIEGGPKLRKWYGAPDQLPKDGGGSTQKEELPEEEGERDAILVTDAESETGQLVVLSLILRRFRVRALVKDPKAATVAFGPYVEPIAGDVTDTKSVDKALTRVRAIVCTTKVGVVASRAKAMGVEHLVLLSQVGVSRKESGGPFGALFGGGLKQAEMNEAAVSASGVPYTIVRAGKLRDAPGGLGFAFSQGDTTRGSITREDAAEVCVRALDAPPSQGVVFEVVNGDKDAPDWAATFGSFTESSPMSS